MALPHCRELLLDDPHVEALVLAAGVHGVYVRNALAAGEGDGVVVSVDDQDVALAWFGRRGNLVLLGDEAALRSAILLRACTEAVVAAARPWRLVMGPEVWVEALRERGPFTPLVCRDQIYYAGSAETHCREFAFDEVRPAQRADRERLVQATLLLNASDLNVDPSRVDRRWLRDTIDERIADGSTRVIGPPAGITCKLEIGSDGPGGQVLEGVFTFPEQRGRHLATRLVASCLAAAPGAVSLHVGQHNRPARAAYERAGMQEVARCRLLLLG